VWSAIGRSGVIALVVSLAACGRDGGRPVLEGQPSIATDDVARDIVGKGPNEGLIGWLFKPDERRDVRLVSVAYQTDAAQAVVHVETQWSRGDETWRMAGQIRVHYRWRQNSWHLVRLESLTFERK
jgi:hypothetical protein